MTATTICAGSVLMKDWRLLFLDEEKIAARSRKLAKKKWVRFMAWGAARCDGILWMVY